MDNTEIDYQQVSIRQANNVAELTYQNVQYQVLVETLQAKLKDLEEAATTREPDED